MIRCKVRCDNCLEKCCRLMCYWRSWNDANDNQTKIESDPTTSEKEQFIPDPSKIR